MKRELEPSEQARERLERATLEPHERAQLWQRIAATNADAPRRRALNATIIVVPLLSAALGAAFLLSTPRERVPAGQPSASADPCALDGRAREFALPAQCSERAVAVGQDQWQLAAGTQIARDEHGDSAQLNSGRVQFKVHKRPAGTQFRVRVSHGEVRVIGTVFVVEQHDGHGSVTVSEGVIEFRWNDGTSERVAAGQSLRWPRQLPVPARPPAVAPVAVPVTDAGTPVRDAGSERALPDLDRVMERLLQLRSQQREREAVALLRKTLQQQGLGVLQRERISYELGLSLEASGMPSCAHWQHHVERFGQSHHASALAERIAHCRE